MKILGIDPGTSGALAILDTKKGTVLIMDMPLRSYASANGKSTLGKGRKTKKGRKFVDGGVIADWIEEHKPSQAVIESVHSFGKEGRASLAKFLTAYGVALGSVQAMLGDRVSLVPPPVWKRKLGLIGKPKLASHTLACRLYPKYRKQLQGPLGGPKIDRSEALLVAHYRSLLP